MPGYQDLQEQIKLVWNHWTFGNLIILRKVR